MTFMNKAMNVTIVSGTVKLKDNISNTKWPDEATQPLGHECNSRRYPFISENDEKENGFVRLM